MSLDGHDREQLEDILERCKLHEVIDCIRSLYRAKTAELRELGTDGVAQMAERAGVAADMLAEARQTAFSARAEIESMLGASAGVAVGIEMGLW